MPGLIVVHCPNISEVIPSGVMSIVNYSLLQKNLSLVLGVVAHAYMPKTQEDEAGRLL